MFGFRPSCYSSYGAWTFTPVGLAPTDHASLRWTHTSGYRSAVDECVGDLALVECAFAQPSNYGSGSSRRSRRPVGPVANPNEKDGHSVFGVIRRENRRARQIRSPAFRRVARYKPHQVWMPAFVLVAKY
jgi:hypothetical protein